MRRTSAPASDGLPVQVLRADAQAIPLPDRSVEHALASHMLYHVPDIKQALIEMRRVVKVGGRVLMTTNAADHSKRLHDLHEQAAREIGLTPTQSTGQERFSLDHLALVQSVFPNVELHRQPNAFVFPTARQRCATTPAAGSIRWWSARRTAAIGRLSCNGCPSC